MPLAIDPDQTFEVVLKSDQEKPTPEQTRFKFRYMTAREFVRTAAVGDMSREEQEALGLGELVKRIFDAIHANLQGFIGPYIEKGSDLEDAITISEAWELYYSARRQSKLSVTEKNDSGSPSPISGDDSAKDVPDKASASTPSTSGSPASSNAPDAEKPAATTATTETSD